MMIVMKGLVDAYQVQLDTVWSSDVVVGRLEKGLEQVVAEGGMDEERPGN